MEKTRRTTSRTAASTTKTPRRTTKTTATEEPKPAKPAARASATRTTTKPAKPAARTAKAEKPAAKAPKPAAKAPKPAKAEKAPKPAKGAKGAEAAKAPRKKKAAAEPEAAARSQEPVGEVDPVEVRREHSREVAKQVAIAALDRKAERIEIIDIADKVDYADFLVLMSGRSDRQVKGIAAGIEEALQKHGTKSLGVEGLAQGHWVLLNYGDVIVHVFVEEARRYYDIEGLWMDARRVPFEAGQNAGAPSVPPTANAAPRT